MASRDIYLVGTKKVWCTFDKFGVHYKSAITSSVVTHVSLGTIVSNLTISKKKMPSMQPALIGFLTQSDSLLFLRGTGSMTQAVAQPAL